jgi:hypothetical protein
MFRTAGITILVITSVLLSGACEKSGASVQPTPSPVINTPIWEKEAPAGWQEITDKPVNVQVDWERVQKGSQSLLQFHLTEEHGYMVDGISLEFWYRFKDEKTGAWVDDPKKIGFFVPNRLEPKKTLVASTPLLDIEFKHLGADLGASKKENWGVKYVANMRAMEPKQ